MAAYEYLWFFAGHLERLGRLRLTRVHFVTIEPIFMSYAGHARSRLLAERAAAKGVKVLTNAEVAEIKEGEVVLGDGRRLESELTMVFPELAPPAAFETSRDLEKNGDGFLGAEITMKAEKHGHDNLWVLGDSIGFAGAKTGRIAEVQGRVAAYNIARELGVVKAGPRRYISELLSAVRYGPGLASFLWTRPAPRQGWPRRFALAAMGRWPYFFKVGLEKVWLAGHR